MADGAAKTKVAILGGGIGALSAAYELTKNGDCDITIYTLGWRLGGKCASSRGVNGRIEEHGIHGFLGSYYNANPMLKEIYDELAKPPPAGYLPNAAEPVPPRTYKDAIIFMDALQMYEKSGQGTGVFNAIFPPDTIMPDPGKPGALFTLEEILDIVLALTGHFHGQNALHPHFGLWETILKDISAALARGKAASAARDCDHPVAGALAAAMAKIADAAAAPEGDANQAFQIVEWLLVMLNAAYGEDVIGKGFDHLDDTNWSDLLRKYGATEALLGSPIALNTVNLSYQIPKGDHDQPSNMAAGAYLHWSLRSLAYCGHAICAFAAGTGETLITPFYQLLLRRGVKFNFFSKVTALHVSGDKTEVASVDIDVQAQLVDGLASYQPLKPVNGWMCWPAHPHYVQLKNPDLLRQVNLESYWADTSKLPPIKQTLVAGKDYDKLVFALSVGAVPIVCQELITTNTGWQDMVDHLPTVQTQAFQVWMNQDMQQLGWTIPLSNHDTALSDTYQDPINGHCEMRHLIALEGWPASNPPKSLWYFCDVMRDDHKKLPPPTDTGYPQQMADQVKANAIDYLNKHMADLLPKATNASRGSSGPPAGLDFDLLYGATPGEGEKAFDNQFWRANIDPTERYVQSPAGSTKYRMLPWKTGFSNLLIAGDWTYTGINVGSVECAVMSGRLVSYGLLGKPALIDIPGFPLPGTGPGGI